MAKQRSYKLLCPIARALDRIGDRWTLLILRDLHAGPARFTDLQKGLKGIAANLLTERLVKLTDDGLITKTEAGHGASVYTLTELGARTLDLIFELAVYGAQFEPEGDVNPPGNLRTVATTLGAAAKRISTTGMKFDALLVVDDEEIHLSVDDDVAEARYGGTDDPDIVLKTGYTDLLDVSEGALSLEEFAQARSRMEIRTPGKELEFINFMQKLTALLQNQESRLE